MENDDEAMETDSQYYKLDEVPIEIEELTENDIPESELSEFVDADTFVVNQKADKINWAGDCDEIFLGENEELLIQKLIDGELTYNEYKEQTGQNVENIELEEYYDEIEDGVPVSKSENLEETTEENENKTDIRKKVKRKRSVLPAALQGLMGEANLCFARGDIELAEKVCLEIIRQVPLASEPFLTLAQIYEGNDLEKFMQFSLIAAHLNPANTDLWVRLSELSFEQGHIKQAITCLTEAIRANPRNMDIRMRRINLLESIGENKFAFRCYVVLVHYIPREQGDFLLKTAKMVAEKFHKDKKFGQALNALTVAYQKVPELFQIEDINILCDLHLFKANYKNVLDILSWYIGFPINLVEIMDSKTNEMTFIVENVYIPDDMNMDFRTKLIVSVIHLKAFKLLDYLVDNALKNIDVEEAGDCHLDIAEALMKEKYYKDALRLLIPLVNSTNFSLAAVWLRHADCYRAIHEYDNAIESYKMVVQLAPQHYDARLVLSALLKQKGKDTEALKVLEQDAQTDLLDPKLLYERCFLLKESQNFDEYLIVGLLLLSRHCIRLRNHEEMGLVMVVGKKLTVKFSSIKEMRNLKLETLRDDDQPEFISDKNKNQEGSTADNLTPEIEWKLVEEMYRVSMQLKKYYISEKLSFYLLTSKLFQNYQTDIEFYALQSCILNRDSITAYKLIKEYITRNIDNKKIWNLFNCVLQISDDITYNRFLLRYFQRIELKNPLIHLLQTNYFLLSGSYKYALNDYLSVYKRTNNPLATLLCGITLAQLSCQKFMAKKQSLIKQAIGFFYKYKELRKNMTKYEVEYNFGRLYHQFNISSMALFHYKNVLNPDPKDQQFLDENADYASLKSEAAYNCHLIYKTSGNLEMARKMLFDNIVI